MDYTVCRISNQELEETKNTFELLPTGNFIIYGLKALLQECHQNYSRSLSTRSEAEQGKLILNRSYLSSLLL